MGWGSFVDVDRKERVVAKVAAALQYIGSDTQLMEFQHLLLLLEYGKAGIVQ